MPSLMNRRLKRWLSILLLGALAFAQANFVMAACSMDRGNLAQMLAGETHDCCEEGALCETGGVVPMSVTACLSHSTSDLQTSAGFVSITVPPSVGLVRLVPPPSFTSLAPPDVFPVQHRAVPARILLHSFLI